MTNPVTILPHDPEMAINKLIDITTELRMLMEAEARHIATQDEAGLRGAEAAKADMVEQYQKAAAEFTARSAEFRATDTALIDRLRSEQEALALITKDNQHFLRA